MAVVTLPLTPTSHLFMYNHPPEGGRKHEKMKTLVEKLKNYNRWRRGDETIPQPSPKEVGGIIDQAIEALENYLKHKEAKK